MPISGKILPVGKTVENQYELFEFFGETNKGLSRATLLQGLGRTADFNSQVSDADLLAEYCEALVTAVPWLSSFSARFRAEWST